MNQVREGIYASLLLLCVSAVKGFQSCRQACHFLHCIGLFADVDVHLAMDSLLGTTAAHERKARKTNEGKT